MDQKGLEFLIQKVKAQFFTRIIQSARRNKRELNATINVEIKDKELWITLKDGDIAHNITVPIPQTNNGITLIEQNEVKRAVHKFYLPKQDMVLTFLDVIYRVICDNPKGLVSDDYIKKGSFVQQLNYAYYNKTLPIVVFRLQKCINEVVNQMPLHETYMNSWVMNHRLVIIDPDFDNLQSPAERHKYQVAKSRAYFNRGWTSIGLSDGSLADKNYILTNDLRKLSPFGLRHHNPQRNLYSTLGMKGDEMPLVRSKSMQDLIDQGISRGGWNLFTVFVDIPDVWEDQIMVDESHKDKGVTYEKRYQCFGGVLVNEGQPLKQGQQIAIAPDGQGTYFKLLADKAWVDRVVETTVNVGARPYRAFNVIVKYRRNFKDGMKITNLAANKGIIRMTKLGYAIDPRTGEKRKIDVIVSSRAVQKRKNYSQVLEALVNNVNNDKVAVLSDDYEVSMEVVEARLKREGLPEDGTWHCDTYAGSFECVCGPVFWGITKDCEDQIWSPGDTERVNNKGRRTAGLKFSTVEFRALNTRFGKNNPIQDEIFSYAQGYEDIHELLTILQSKKGIVPTDVNIRTVNLDKVREVNQTESTIVPVSTIKNTLADDSYLSNGFIMKLPIQYQVQVDSTDEVIFEGAPGAHPTTHKDITIKNSYTFDRIYIPGANLRRCWRHGTGEYGLSEICTLINNIVVIGKRHIAEPNESLHITMLYRAVAMYFKRIADIMGTKRGDLSVYGMSIRYPHSTKAVAALGNHLPKNTIEIHTSMAKQLRVQTGDFVLVERFPCLGFMSLRPQKIKVTNDPQCLYTIRVSGNSLGSMSLDFDGDVLFLASFHTPKAKEALRKEWTNPNKSCYNIIQELNKKMGSPHTKALVLQDYNITSFSPLTIDEHEAIVGKLTGVKSFTGPVVALAYNVMRIAENSTIKNDQKTNCAVEFFLDKVANSVFKQKHGIKSLHQIVMEAICMADVETLVQEGFARGTSTIICRTIREKAAELGIKNLKQYHEFIQQKGGSNIINLIVRKQNKIYFASRSQLEGCSLLAHLEAPAVDVPSKMLKKILSGKSGSMKTTLDVWKDEKSLNSLPNEDLKVVCNKLFTYLDEALTGYTKPVTTATIANVRKINKKLFKRRPIRSCQQSRSEVNNVQLVLA